MAVLQPIVVQFILLGFEKSFMQYTEGWPLCWVLLVLFECCCAQVQRWLVLRLVGLGTSSTQAATMRAQRVRQQRATSCSKAYHAL